MSEENQAPPPGYPIEATCSRGCPGLQRHPWEGGPNSKYANWRYCGTNQHDVLNPDEHGCADHPAYERQTAGLGETQLSVKEWATSIQPAELPGRVVFVRLMKEVRELRAALLSDEPADEAWYGQIQDEIADVQIMLWHMANHTGVDVQEVVNRKMAINRKEAPGETGESEES